MSRFEKLFLQGNHAIGNHEEFNYGKCSLFEHQFFQTLYSGMPFHLSHQKSFFVRKNGVFQGIPFYINQFFWAVKVTYTECLTMPKQACPRSDNITVACR